MAGFGDLLDDLQEWAEDFEADRSSEPLGLAVREARDRSREFGVAGAHVGAGGAARQADKPLAVLKPRLEHLAQSVRQAAAAERTADEARLRAEEGAEALSEAEQAQREARTRHEVLREPVVLADPVVYVCENPAILAAAADRLGSSCRPLLCTEGQPRSALCQLLAGLSCEVRYHGDFDWPGIRIANLVVDRFGARPWRMGREDYLAAVGRGKALQGVPATPLWDEGLRVAMVERGRAVHEEQVVGVLLGDLGGSPGGLGHGTWPTAKSQPSSSAMFHV